MTYSMLEVNILEIAAKTNKAKHANSNFFRLLIVSSARHKQSQVRIFRLVSSGFLVILKQFFLSAE